MSASWAQGGRRHHYRGSCGGGRPGRHRGVAAVEFALLTSLLSVLLFAGIEAGRLLWTWNAAVEATRLGARLAVVCDLHEGVIAERMRRILPALQRSQIVIDYLNPPASDNSCIPEDCKAVRVSLAGAVHRTLVPGLQRVVLLPSMQTTLRKESMDSSDNEVCQ